jgi:general secretion pathway protein E
LAVNSQDEAVDGHIRDDALPVALNRPQQFRSRRLAQFNQIMRPLRLAGALRVAEGLTTLEEVISATPPLE